MNKKRIEEILELMEKYGLNEMDLEEENLKLHFRKGAEVQSVVQAPMQVAQAPVAAAAAAPAEAKEDLSKYIEIKAPMVGTFYESPAPDASAFVGVGSQIKDGDVLCILEAMKLMNEIKAEVSGKIAKIMVENAEPVEFGQVLFLVEPN